MSPQPLFWQQQKSPGGNQWQPQWLVLEATLKSPGTLKRFMFFMWNLSFEDSRTLLKRLNSALVEKVHVHQSLHWNTQNQINVFPVSSLNKKFTSWQQVLALSRTVWKSFFNQQFMQIPDFANRSFWPWTRALSSVEAARSGKQVPREGGSTFFMLCQIWPQNFLQGGKGSKFLQYAKSGLRIFSWGVLLCIYNNDDNDDNNDGTVTQISRFASRLWRGLKMNLFTKIETVCKGNKSRFHNNDSDLPENVFERSFHFLFCAVAHQKWHRTLQKLCQQWTPGVDSITFARTLVQFIRN